MTSAQWYFRAISFHAKVANIHARTTCIWTDLGVFLYYAGERFCSISIQCDSLTTWLRSLLPYFPGISIVSIAYDTLINFWRYNKVNLATSAFRQTLADFTRNVKQVEQVYHGHSPRGQPCCFVKILWECMSYHRLLDRNVRYFGDRILPQDVPSQRTNGQTEVAFREGPLICALFTIRTMFVFGWVGGL